MLLRLVCILSQANRSCKGKPRLFRQDQNCPFEEHFGRKEAIRISSNALAMKICTYSFGQNHQKRERGEKFFNESTERSRTTSPASSCCALASSRSISMQQSFLIVYLITPNHIKCNRET